MNNGRLKVLIVDDAELVINRVIELLKEMTVIENILGVGSFNQAIQSLSVDVPDLVLLDIQLPGKSGIELLTHVKQHYPKIKIIMLTNKAGLYYKAICEKAGCDHFIDKSSDFEKIPNIIESYAC
ncbi:MAG: response regulator transcription factor [Ferruginibacter sp.]